MAGPRLVSLIGGVLAALAAGPLAAQETAARPDTDRALVLVHEFREARDTAVIDLRRHVVYIAEITGPGTLDFQPVRKRPRPAFLVPIAAGAGDQPRRYEVYPLQDGAHRVTLADLPAGDSARLRLYEDVGQTLRIATKLERALAVGITVAVGHHTGYRLDPTGGAEPAGGADFEVGLLAETGSRFSTLMGAGGQSFPDAGYRAAWLFLEERGRLLTRHLLGRRRTDLVAVARYSLGISVGPRRLNPALLGVGLEIAQHLAPAGQRRGWRVELGWRHDRLGSAPETERLDADRFTVGLTWTP